MFVWGVTAARVKVEEVMMVKKFTPGRDSVKCKQGVVFFTVCLYAPLCSLSGE